MGTAAGGSRLFYQSLRYPLTLLQRRGRVSRAVAQVKLKGSSVLLQKRDNDAKRHLFKTAFSGNFVQSCASLRGVPAICRRHPIEARSRAKNNKGGRPK